MAEMAWSSNRMLFVTWAANLGGVQSSLATRIRGLRELGYLADVLFCYTGNGRSSFRNIYTYVTRSQETVRKLVLKKRYSVISFINLTPFLPALRAARFGGTLLYELRGYSQHCLTVCSGLSNKEFGAILVPSEYVAALIERTKPPHQLPIHVLYNAVDPNLFRPRSDSFAPVSPRLEATPPRRPVLLWVGRLDWNKNYPELLQIVASLKRDGERFITWVVTDSKASKGVEVFLQDVRAAGLTSHVRLFENVPREEMVVFYHHAAASGGCLISTSRSEGLQNTVLEAMASGCPVVTTAAGGNLEIVTHGVNGAIYPSGRPDLGAAQVASLLRNALKRDRFIQEGLLRIATHHTPREHAERFLQIAQNAPRAVMQ